MTAPAAPKSRSMKVFSKEGVEMMDVRSIDKDGDTLIIKGKMMGAMMTTIHVKPEDMWAAFRMLPGKVLWSLPALMLRGWKAGRAPRP